MKEMNLGRILIENRHKRGITQDEPLIPRCKNMWSYAS